MKAITPITVLSALLGITESFNVASRFSRTQRTVLYGRVDSSDAVKAALEASKKFGPTSKEAQTAWEAVEEMDSSDNSAAYTGGVSEEDQQYDEKMAALAALLEENQAKIYEMKKLAQELQAVKLVDPQKVKTVAAPNPMLKKLLAEAKEATEKHGIDSTEAKLAWESVEEAASADSSEVMKPSLEDECLIEAMEACEALEELGRAISLLKNKGDRFSG